MWFKKKKPAREVTDEETERIRRELRVELLKKILPPHNNWKGNKYVERLIKEWLTHGKIVLACDFDDTVFPWGFKSEEDVLFLKKVMNIVKLAQQMGCYLSIWSACSPERFGEIHAWCYDFGIKVDSINENPIPLPYGNHRKMYYNHLLDDRAGLEQALDMLEYACYRVQSDRKEPAVNFDC